MHVSLYFNLTFLLYIYFVVWIDERHGIVLDIQRPLYLLPNGKPCLPVTYIKNTKEELQSNKSLFAAIATTSDKVLKINCLYEEINIIYEQLEMNRIKLDVKSRLKLDRKAKVPGVYAYIIYVLN